VSSIQKDYLDPNLLFPDALYFMERQTTEFLQVLFSQFPKGQYHYDLESQDQCDILIEGRTTDNLENVDTRPKIVVGRGGVSWENRGINNFIGSRNLSLESQKFSDILSGTVGVSCFSREPLEADRIANICFGAFKKFRTVLRQQGYLMIRSAQVGQRAMIKKDVRPELYVTPVMIESQVTENWTVSRLGPVKLKEIITKVET
jgi:hypothetical protein